LFVEEDFQGWARTEKGEFANKGEREKNVFSLNMRWEGKAPDVGKASTFYPIEYLKWMSGCWSAKSLRFGWRGRGTKLIGAYAKKENSEG